MEDKTVPATGSGESLDLSCDVLVVGGGFAGVYAAIAAQRAGLRVAGVEAGTGFGGVWFWNRYPGARCDLESLDYSYSFDEELQQEWRWSERYATQPEILAYIEHVAKRYDLHRVFTFGVRVEAMAFDEDRATWTVVADDGTVRTARYVMLATGSLSIPLVPDLPGLADFAGRTVFTAQWPEEGVDLAGRRVGVIGTGSSGVQSVPLFAEAAAELTVFQRTANYSVPVRNRYLEAAQLEQELRRYPERRAISWASPAGSLSKAYPKTVWEIDEQERRAVLEERWNEGGVLFGKVFPDQTIDPAVNEVVARFAEEKIRGIVEDPAVADDLVPNDHPIGTKRICTDSGYYAAFNQPHVSLVNLRREPIVEVTPTGVRTTDRAVELDVLVLATGFDAMTGSFTRIDVRGPRGDRLADLWADGPLTYLGMTVPGLPNLVLLNGPGSPSVLANMVLTAEQQVNWAVELIVGSAAAGHTTFEARRDAAEAWTDHVHEVAQRTLFARAKSWYVGANVPGKPQVFMPYIGGFKTYIDRCDDARDRDWAGLVLRS